VNNKKKPQLNTEKKGTHQFAFFVSDLTSLLAKQKKSELRISDEKLYHRVMRVVRLNVGETCILFDEKNNVHFEFHAAEGKKHIDGTVICTQKNKVLAPQITFLLPMIKREYFETALYSLVELGVNVVQPIITQKTKRKWKGQKEQDRLFQIMVAAAEQSKNFSIPELKNPISFVECCKASVPETAAKLFFDSSGDPVAAVLERSKDKELMLMVGPEGDLTEAEKELLQNSGFEFCSLTPTVLRSLQAAALSVGIFRSFLSR